jgi:hypothetical protein
VNSDNERKPRAVKEKRVAGPGGLAKASPQARRLAAAVLEVLSGLRGPTEAAEATGLSLPRYYALEARALVGLVRGCEPVPPGRQPGAGTELQSLRQKCQALERQAARLQSLLRLQQRALGLNAAPATAGGAEKKKGGKKRRRPRQRALRLVEQLRRGQADGPADTAGAEG